jgi:hypothetical protein
MPWRIYRRMRSACQPCLVLTRLSGRLSRHRGVLGSEHMNGIISPHRNLGKEVNDHFLGIFLCPPVDLDDARYQASRHFPTCRSDPMMRPAKQCRIEP